jgi:hypothetical protein
MTHQQRNTFARCHRRGNLEVREWNTYFGGEFDPGSGSTLAACLMHASRTEPPSGGHVADG